MVSGWISVATCPQSPDPDTQDFPYVVGPSDPEQLLIEVWTNHNSFDRYADTEWVFVLEWTCAGDSGQLVIDDSGRPFFHP